MAGSPGFSLPNKKEAHHEREGFYAHRLLYILMVLSVLAMLMALGGCSIGELVECFTKGFYFDDQEGLQSVRELLLCLSYVAI